MEWHKTGLCGISRSASRYLRRKQETILLKANLRYRTAVSSLPKGVSALDDEAEAKWNALHSSFRRLRRSKRTSWASFYHEAIMQHLLARCVLRLSTERTQKDWIHRRGFENDPVRKTFFEGLKRSIWGFVSCSQQSSRSGEESRNRCSRWWSGRMEYCREVEQQNSDSR